jgi:cytochrome c-type biogenesis protein CcmF
MLLAHAGVGVFVIGVTLVSSQQQELDTPLRAGEVATLGSVRLKLQDVRSVDGPNYRAAEARLVLSRPGQADTVLRPQKRLYESSEMPMTESAIERDWRGDVYVSLAEPVDTPQGRAWIVHLAIKPYVAWVWGGVVLMALGGLLSATDRRYRTRGGA